MTSAEACEFAPTWGSYMRAGDPGACLYGFSDGDGRPQTEEHRQRCLEQMRLNLLHVKADPQNYDDDEAEQIERFIAWMETAPTKESTNAVH